MLIHVSRQGKQYGPFSPDQIKSYLDSGRLNSTDWAWESTADAWAPLWEVIERDFSEVAEHPNLPPPPAPDVEPITPPEEYTERSEPAIAPNPSNLSSEEELIWEGSPSQVINLPSYVWLSIIAIISFGLLCFDPSISEYIANTSGFTDEEYYGLKKILSYLFQGVIFFSIVSMLGCFAKTRSYNYTVTTQRLRISFGLVGRTVCEVEYFRVRDVIANQSPLLRIFGLGTLKVLSGDENYPILLLTAIPNAMELRERLRNEVLNMRKKYGVRGTEVMGNRLT